MKRIFVAFLILSLCVGLQSPVEAKEKLKIAVMHSVTGVPGPGGRPCRAARFSGGHRHVECPGRDSQQIRNCSR